MSKIKGKQIKENSLVQSKFNVNKSTIINNNIYCGGGFTTFNSESHTYFIKLNQNGSSLTT